MYVMVQHLLMMGNFLALSSIPDFNVRVKGSLRGNSASRETTNGHKLLRGVILYLTFESKNAFLVSPEGPVLCKY